jgi:predicted dehydrogenase
MTIDLDLQHHSPPPRKKDFRIGAIGAGFIMRDCHLVAYRNAGYNVVAITSQPPEQAREVAQLRGIPKVYPTNQELLADLSIEVVDIAVPPNLQLPVVREAVKHAGHIKGILAQKPLATNYQEAREIVCLCNEAGITLGVNQNMRYDQSIRALKTVLNRGYLGELVLATIEMRAIPHWQA